MDDAFELLTKIYSEFLNSERNPMHGLINLNPANSR